MLPAALRLLLITDGSGDVARIGAVVRAAARGGLRSVLVREPRLPAGQRAALCLALRRHLRPAGGLVLVHGDVELARQGVADGVHLAQRGPAAAAVRPLLPPPLLLGVSAHDAGELAAAAVAGADYATLSPVFATASHPQAVPLGVGRASALAAGAGLPVLWLGGIDIERAGACAHAGATGVAMISGLFAAADVTSDARRLARMFQVAPQPPRRWPEASAGP